MSLAIYSTLERRKVPFVPRNPGEVSIYSCGITPYGPTHLGHARQYVLWDVFRRFLEWQGYRVTYVQNFTDIDDKIIAKAKREGVSAADIAQRHIDEYFGVMDMLGVVPATAYPRVTDHIGDVIAMVRELVARGVAYVVEGDVFFDVSAHEGYGKLSHRTSDDLDAGARVDVNERKQDPADFAVWKSAKPDEPSWDSPWGPGRPGWHIECSAMALKYLGSGFDMHGGGMDLIFPHHENEVAQAEGATGQPFARYWMHHGFINVNAEKMSKSLGNFQSVRDLLAVHDPQAVRMFLISTHYRSPISFSNDELVASTRSRERLLSGLHTLEALAGVAAEAEPDSDAVDVGRALGSAAHEARARFVAAMDDDMNTALALASLFDLVREANRAAGSGSARAGRRIPGADIALAVMTELMGVLGLTAVAASGPAVAARSADNELAAGLMELVLQLRRDARASKQWAVSDQIRDALKALGIALEDTSEGTRWRRTND